MKMCQQKYLVKKQKNIIRGTNQFISPPVLSFVWGQRVYDVLMETASIKKNMFNAQLQTMDMYQKKQFLKNQLKLYNL